MADTGVNTEVASSSQSSNEVFTTSMASHPLAAPPSPPKQGGAIFNDPITLPSFSSRGTVRGGYSSISGNSSSSQRPGYFDLQRLAAQAEAEEAQRKVAADAPSMYAASVSAVSTSASSSVASEAEAEDEAEDEDDEDEEAIPTDEDTLSWQRTSSPPSRGVGRKGQAESRRTIYFPTSSSAKPTRPSSRASMYSPPIIPKSQRDIFQSLEAGPSKLGEGQKDVPKEERDSLRYLCSLQFMTDPQLEQQLGASTLQRPLVSPHMEKKVPDGEGIASTPRLGEDREDSVQGFSPIPSQQKRNSIIRSLSEALKNALDESQAATLANEQASQGQVAALGSQQRRHNAREAALKEIILSVGISEARIARALTHATTQADVPVFQADKRLADNLSQTTSASPISQLNAPVPKQQDGDEQLPENLREAMLDGFDVGLGIDTTDSTQRRERSPSFGAVSNRSSNAALQRSAAAEAVTSSEAIDLKASSHGISQRTSSPTFSRLSERVRSSTGKEPVPQNPPTSRSGPPAASSNFGWASTLVPWGSSTHSSRKAAASVQTHSPSAVEADGYLSDHARHMSSPPRSPTPRRAHTRSASISAIIAATNEEGDKVQKPTSSSGAYGLLGSLAWRRKKSLAPAEITAKASQASEDSPGSEDCNSYDHERLSTQDASSTIERMGSGLDVHDINETIRAKASPLRPQAQQTLSGQDVSQALYEAIGSFPPSPESERVMAQIASSSLNDLPKPPHFKAIFLSTRIMSSEAGSVLLDNGKKTSAFVARLAMSLVGRARDEGRVIEEEKKGASRRLSVPSRPSSRVANKASAPSTTGPIPVSPKDVDARPSLPVPASSTAAASTAATLGRALGRYKKAAYREKQSSGKMEPNVTKLPEMFGLGMGGRKVVGALRASQSTAPTTKSREDGNEKESEMSSPARRAPAPSVELEPILSNDVKPPTLALFARKGLTGRPTPAPKKSKRSELDRLDEEESSGDEFEVYGGKGLAPDLPQPINSRSEDATELLTDRYGFVYDATPADVRLLRRARKAATAAPACLTGIRVGVRARGGTDSQSDEEKEKDQGDERESEDDKEALEASVEDSQGHADGKGKGEVGRINEIANERGYTAGDGEDSDAESQRTVSSRKTAGTRSNGLLSVAPPKAVAEASQVSVPSHTHTSPSQERDFDLSTEMTKGTIETLSSPMAKGKDMGRPHSTSQTVRKLLGQLQEMHESQQTSQQTEWDDFLERRRESMRRRTGPELVEKPGGILSDLTTEKAPEEDWTLGLVGYAQLTAAAHAPSSGASSNQTRVVPQARNELGDFLRLVRGGIPLLYRSKIWAECSGANEVAEPGRYQELLKEHKGERNQCTDQIDLDVGRTMPTNVYFGGEGPGVPKLRRLLVAFSWYNPRCGYCQGMNNLAATLLLTHATEEEAFWVLVCIIEKILPAEYYTSHLLVSQADQRVLIDLVDERLPNLSFHIHDLGVDLPAVTFAWFLSLYTDCLPVETLFRVWDVFFVEGMVILFRVAIAILILNEEKLLSTESPSAFYSHVHSMTSHLFSSDRLLKLACDELKEVIGYDKVVEKRKGHVTQLIQELGLHEMEG